MSPEDGAGAPPPLPLATYRLQLRNGVGFREAAELVPYLDALGVTHAYCSPYLRARAGSDHGYDVVDHNALDPALGSEDDFRAFAAALRRHGMGQILDFVPNHVGIGRGENAWWLDVLEYGRNSPFASYFDIDWQPPKTALRGKVLLPVLGDHYGEVLERGELVLRFDAGGGSFSVWYHEHRFPVAPRLYARVLGEAAEIAETRLGGDPSPAASLRSLGQRFRALVARSPSRRRRTALREEAESAKRALAELASREPELRASVEEAAHALGGKAGAPRSFERLHRLLQAQHYRLAYWRVADDEINYRRFFDIHDLAALRMEREEVFDATHRSVLSWIEEGLVDGLRIDHVDGLFDPRRYCERLRARLGPRYLIVEKILADHERLRSDWPVDGTSGYEFLNLLNGLFVDPDGEEPLDSLYRELFGGQAHFDDLLYACKKHVVNFLLGSELQVLAGELDRISEVDWRSRDFTLTSIREALKEIVACFPVYRSYVSEAGASPEDRSEIERAVREGRSRSSDPEQSLFDWLHGVLRAEPAPAPRATSPRRSLLRFAMRFQQYTAPVTAKALEDTSFYRYQRLVSLNEVGGDPRRFGVETGVFHAANEERARDWPHSMLGTSTHDTKRSEDVRARIDVLSEIPEEWREHVRSWAEWARPHKREVDGRLAPWPSDEYLLYQTLLGSWPLELDRDAGAPAWAAYRERVERYAIKAVREGKQTSSWRHPNAAYEEALLGLLGHLLDPARGRDFLDDFLPFQARVAELGALDSLSQLLLKLTSPGVPDVYQGCELWDLSLADPDNRRPVDHDLRRRLLAELRQAFGDDPEQPGGGDVRSLVERWRDGRLKLFVTWRLLGLRRRRRELFQRGRYLPLATRDPSRGGIVAFARLHEAASLVVAAPRLCAQLPRSGAAFPLGGVWGDAAVSAPADGPTERYRNVLSGGEVAVRHGANGPELRAAELFAELPLAALVPAGGSAGER